MRNGGTSSKPELQLKAHRYSMEAFEVAKAFVTGSEDAEALKGRARELHERLPDLSSQLPSVPEQFRAAINHELADARLDLVYVLSDGKLPTSMRLHHFAADR